MTTLLTIDSTTSNAHDPHTLAEFWGALLGGVPRDTGNGFVLLDPGAGSPRLLFQRSDDTNSSPGWIHLDCSTPDRDAAVASITGRGGRLVERRSDSNGDWIVMADPEGNPFCI